MRKTLLKSSGTPDTTGDTCHYSARGPIKP
jgi:hypothetical protein